MKILLIEDDRLLRRATERALMGAGYEVASVSDGEEGLRLAGEGGHDLILLDMMLPKVTGLSVLRALKQDARTKHIPVVVLSGLSEKNRAKLLQEGAEAYMEKSEMTFRKDSSLLLRTIAAVLTGADSEFRTEEFTQAVSTPAMPPDPKETDGGPEGKTTLS